MEESDRAVMETFWGEAGGSKPEKQLSNVLNVLFYCVKTLIPFIEIEQPVPVAKLVGGASIQVTVVALTLGTTVKLAVVVPIKLP